ncbi:MAG: co-chaperone GroES [Candidatus Pacebacteria bacterium]|nr:co-chaperone GroES [Candidatus Paceibacterota bacterium]
MAKKEANKGAKGVTPLGDRVLIKPLELDTKTPSGIIIPDSAKKKESKQGKVIALGAGKVLENGTLRPIDGISVGDTVLYRQGWDNEVEIDDEKHYLISESDVLAVIG